MESYPCTPFTTCPRTNIYRHTLGCIGCWRLEEMRCVVNGWPSSPFMASFEPLVRLSNRLRSLTRRLSSVVQHRERPKPAPDQTSPRPAGKAGRANQQPAAGETQGSLPDRKGTFTSRHDVAWMKNEVGGRIPLEILVWRSASVRFMRAVIFSWLGGRYWLRLLFCLEERSPHYYGENGQYPLIVIEKRSKYGLER